MITRRRASQLLIAHSCLAVSVPVRVICLKEGLGSSRWSLRRPLGPACRNSAQLGGMSSMARSEAWKSTSPDREPGDRGLSSSPCRSPSALGVCCPHPNRTLEKITLSSSSTKLPLSWSRMANASLTRPACVRDIPPQRRRLRG